MPGALRTRSGVSHRHSFWRRRDERLKAEILRVWKANHRVFGTRKVWIVLRGEGVEVARCTVELLMRELGIAGARRGKPRPTTIADEAAERPELVATREESSES